MKSLTTLFGRQKKKGDGVFAANTQQNECNNNNLGLSRCKTLSGKSKGEVRYAARSPDEEQDPEASEALLTDDQLSRDLRVNHIIKYSQTAAIFGTFFSFAFTINMLGPTLLHLADRMSTDVVKAATLFMWRGIGALIGGLVFGRVLDLANPLAVLPLLCVTCSVVTATVPLSSLVEVTSTIFFLQGLFVTALSIGSNTCIFRIWRQSRGLVHQTLHFLFPVAGLLTPQLINLYTPPLVYPTANMTTLEDISNMSDLKYNASPISSPYVYGDIESCGHHSNSCNPPGSNMTSSHSQLEKEHFGFNYQGLLFAYTINAGVVGFSAIPFLILLLRKDTRTISRKLSKDKDTELRVRNKPSRVIQGLIVTTACVFGAMETAFNGLIIPFAVEFLKWEHSTAANFLSARFAAFCASRLLGAAVSTRVKPATFLGINHFITVTSCFVLSALVSERKAILWTFGLLASFSVGPNFATYLLWAGDQFPVTGVFTSAYVVGQGIGNLVSPPLVATLCHSISYIWFIHAQTIMAILITLLYVIIIFVRIRNNAMQLSKP